MTTDALPAPGRESTAAGRDLLRQMLRHPDGQVSPSAYETGRLVSLAPWAAGHDGRVAHLLATQRSDGGWGGPGAYAIVPTLSVVEALLATASDAPEGLRRDRLTHAAGVGLRLLAGTLLTDPAPIPDTPAVDLIVPDLLRRIDAHLTARPGADRPPRLPLPVGMSGDRYAAVRRLLRSGADVPEKLLHAYETVAAEGRRPALVPTASGAVGASPAATAAWLAGPAGAAAHPAASAYLTEVGTRAGGPVPCTTPITVFERSWVLSQLLRAGLPPAVPELLLAELAAGIGPHGTATSPGLPPDTDTTAVVLYALARSGRPVSPEPLAGYDTGGHFCTWPGEDGASVTTNAHVLEALGWHARAEGPRPGPAATTARRLAGWLIDQQLPEGWWHDRWHASPYYATSCVALAVARYGDDPRAGWAVDRAVEWVLATQRPDGSWGRWEGTAEETAYALHVLLGRGGPVSARVAAAVDAALAFLTVRPVDDGPALWHDKDLYHPRLIVEAAVVAAVHLAGTTPVAPGAGPSQPAAIDGTVMIRKG